MLHRLKPLGIDLATSQSNKVVRRFNEFRKLRRIGMISAVIILAIVCWVFDIIAENI